MRKLFVGMVAVALAACSGTGPTAPSPAPDVDTVLPVTTATVPQTAPSPTKVVHISENGTVTVVPENRNWTACVYNANKVGDQTLLYQYPVSTGKNAFELSEEVCGKFFVQIDVQSGARCPKRPVSFQGFKGGRLLPAKVDFGECPKVCEDTEPKVWYGEWTEWKDVIQATTREVCTEDVRQVRHRARYEQECDEEPVVTRETEYRTIDREIPCKCDEEPVLVSTEKHFKGECSHRVVIYQERWEDPCTGETVQKERREPAPVQCEVCPLPEVRVLSWRGAGDPATECAAFGDYVPSSPYRDNNPAFYICKAGNDREVWLSEPGATCRNGKERSHTTRCICAPDLD